MWLDKLKELKKSSKMSSKQIADATGIPESTVKRIFAGETDNPYVDTLRRIVTVLGSSLDEIFAESKIRIANTDQLQDECNMLIGEANSLRTENTDLKRQLVILEAEIDHLRLTLAHSKETLAHKQQIIELQDQLLRIQKNSPTGSDVLTF